MFVAENNYSVYPSWVLFLDTGLGLVSTIPSVYQNQLK